MSVVCPEGHRSEASDYCDTCGSPIGGQPPAAAASSGDGQQALGREPDLGAAAPVGGSAGGGAGGGVLELDPAPVQTCPHCGSPNVEDALFCEACGYDFTTGAAPLGDQAEPDQDEPQPEPEPEPEQDDPEARPGPDDPEPDRDEPEPGQDEPDPEAGPERDEPDPEAGPEQDEPEPRPEQDEPKPRAEQDEPGQHEPTPGTAQDGASQGGPASAEPSGDDPDPDPDPDPDAHAGPRPEEQVQAHARPRHTPPSRTLADTWVVEVWVDPDWYAVQQTDEACPSPGLPDVVVVRRSVVLVGRPSGSRGVRPDVDGGADSAVSRRHAQLTSDGTRWWVEDLGSSNGTYVGVVGEPLPTQALTPGQRVEIDRDDRIYVGAWTRLVLRQATASEQAGQG